jgi:uncharacterized protein with HEPN domain
MPPDEKDDTAVLNNVVAACLRVMNYVHGASRPDLDKDDRLLSACCYQIAVIGECAPSSSTKGVAPALGIMSIHRAGWITG